MFIIAPEIRVFLNIAFVIIAFVKLALEALEFVKFTLVAFVLMKLPPVKVRFDKFKPDISWDE